jgi:alkylated DNA repair protein alkB homolog 8
MCALFQGVPFDQLTVNDYADTVGIAPHVDTHSAFAPVLCSLSLAGTCAMEFRQGSSRRCVFLPPRSLLILAEESRYGWSHGIPTRAADVVLCQGDGGSPTVVVPRAARRVSLTFRRLMPSGNVCTCAWPEQCDSRHKGGDAAATLPEASTCHYDTDLVSGVPAVEVHHVWDLYERIAPHFSATRVAVWPAVKAFLASLPPTSLLLDAGCGNGKYLAPALDAGHIVIGCDVAMALLQGCATEVCSRSGASPRGALFRADVAHDTLLPVRPGAFDAVLCVAVLHHVSSFERRLNLMRGICSALKPGGRAIVTAWATQQLEPERTLRKWKPIHGEVSAGTEGGPGQEYFVPWHVPMHRPEAGAAVRHAAGGSGGESVAGPAPSVAPVVDCAKNTVVYQRYVHLFAPGELTQLAQDVPGVHVEQEFYDSSNWVVILQSSDDISIKQ